MYTCSELILSACCVMQCTAASGGQSEKKKAPPDPHDNRGNTPFFLQDASDEMCLGKCDHRVIHRLLSDNLPVGWLMVTLIQVVAVSQSAMKQRCGS